MSRRSPIERFGNEADRRTAARLFTLLAKEYPTSKLVARANEALDSLNAGACSAAAAGAGACACAARRQQFPLPTPPAAESSCSAGQSPPARPTGWRC